MPFAARPSSSPSAARCCESEAAQALIHDIALLDSMGIRLVLVHGARPQIDAEMKCARPDAALPQRLARHRRARRWNASSAPWASRASKSRRMLSQGLPNTPMAGGFLRVTGGNFITAQPVGVRRWHRLPVHRRGAQGRSPRKSSADLAQENVVLITPIGASPTGEIFNLRLGGSGRGGGGGDRGRQADLPVRRAGPGRQGRRTDRRADRRRGRSSC